MTDNEDKIKVLERAIEWITGEDNYTGICDALNYARYSLKLPSLFSEPSFFNIVLPPRTYYGRSLMNAIFSYPCTKEGKQQRIEVLKQAIKKLQS